MKVNKTKNKTNNTQCLNTKLTDKIPRLTALVAHKNFFLIVQYHTHCGPSFRVFGHKYKTLIIQATKHI